MKNCIVIPTYPAHYDYVKKLLNSIDKYNSDNEVTNIYIIISKYYQKQMLIQEYKTINILILFLEDIIFKVFKNLDKSEDNIYSIKNLYNQCGRYAYQSIKKLIGARYVTTYLSYDNVYILDSEGLFIRPFSMNLIFNNYLNDKKIYYNSKPCSKFLYNRVRHCAIVNEILKTNILVPGWLLENYLWIYEKNILDDFFKLVFKNICTVDDIHKIIKKGTFIELVYYHFIFINNNESWQSRRGGKQRIKRKPGRYNYKFIDTHEQIKKYIKKSEFKKITINRSYSLLEDIRIVINYCPSIIENVSKFFSDNNIINLKIYDNLETNIEFLKTTKSIILINSGDFKLDFNICLENE